MTIPLTIKMTGLASKIKSDNKLGETMAGLAAIVKYNGYNAAIAQADILISELKVAEAPAAWVDVVTGFRAGLDQLKQLDAYAQTL